MSSEAQTFLWPAAQRSGDDASAGVSLDTAASTAAATEAARQQGYQQGHAEGIAQAQTTAAKLADEQQQQLAEVSQSLQEFSYQWQKTQVQLLCSVTQRLIGDTLMQSPDALDHLLQQGLAQLPSQQDFALACHPRRAAEIAQQSEFTVIADPQLGKHVLELRQGWSSIQLDVEQVVRELFADLPTASAPAVQDKPDE